MAEPATPLTTFLQGRAESGYTVQVINRTDPEPVLGMLQDLFGGLSTEVSESELAETDDDMVLLLRDGTVVEASPIEDFKDTLLLVNSDFYQTGAETLVDIDPPDVILRFSGTVFTLQGFPESNTEKLVLTLISRYIELQARQAGAGTLRAAFQRLSRLHDEGGTWQVYQGLGDTDGLETHVYGIPDWTPPADAGLSVHGITTEGIEESWFVVHRQPDGTGSAMVAIDVGENEWRGFWTFDGAEVRAIDDCIRREF